MNHDEILSYIKASVEGRTGSSVASMQSMVIDDGNSMGVSIVLDDSRKITTQVDLRFGDEGVCDSVERLCEMFA